MDIKLDSVSYGCLKKISINPKEGLINGILGGNGSGKSVLANLLGMIDKPIDGHLEINGMIIDHDNPMINYNSIKFNIGYVVQDTSHFIVGKTVKDQIMFTLNQYHYQNKEKKVLDSLKMVDLDDSFLNRKINTLSEGELFKISLANTLVLNPKILILDDPTTFLDYNSKQYLIKLLRMLKNRYHKTIIIMSSNSDFILELCDYIYVLHNYKIAIEGTKYEVFAKKIDKYGVSKPQIIAFEDMVKNKKNIKMGYRDNINDLIKDIYFYKN